jgi:Asp-tRNA(Asn)/Glu-tRNA(Gln) amidotransferase B subunit
MSEVLRELNAEEKSARECPVRSEQLAGIYRLIEKGVIIGPFAHLRPLSEIRSEAKIGNFVEVKNQSSARGPKPITSLILEIPSLGKK